MVKFKHLFFLTVLKKVDINYFFPLPNEVKTHTTEMEGENFWQSDSYQDKAKKVSTGCCREKKVKKNMILPLILFICLDKEIPFI